MKHHVHMLPRSVLMFVLAACAGFPDTLLACNVPVFRYAMERWQADAYRVLVYHRPGALPAAFESLQKGVAERGGTANYSLKTIDVTSPEGKALAERRSIAAYPWVEIYYPVHSPVRAPVWSGPLTVDGARKILNSPTRSRLAQHLLRGDVAVWILVKSGQDQKDRRARESLETSLAQASAALRIPEAGVDVNGNAVDVADFKTYPVRFGLMEVARTDPEEDLLVSALLASEPDLARYDEPVAFPVFGRGRALYALVGDGIQEKNILEACKSMLAWCSCEIKAQNPGTDLLISADWSRPFGGRMVKDPELPLTGVSSFLQNGEPPKPAVAPAAEPAATAALCKREPAVSRAATVPVSPPVQAPDAGGSPLMRNVLYLGGAAGVALLALSLILTVRARK